MPPLLRAEWTQAIDIGVTNGKIVQMGILNGNAAKEIFNAKGLHILPGVIDPQVHFRDRDSTQRKYFLGQQIRPWAA